MPFEAATAHLSTLQQSTNVTQIKSDDEYQSLALAFVDAKKMRADWDKFMTPIRETTDAAHKVACKQFNDIDKPLKAIIERLEPMLIAYEDRRDRQVTEEEKKLNAELETKCDPNEVALAVTLPRVTPPSGLARSSTWYAEVTSLQELVLAVASGEAPLAYLKADESALNKQAKALKHEMKIPGVVAKEDKGLKLNSKSI